MLLKWSIVAFSKFTLLTTHQRTCLYGTLICVRSLPFSLVSDVFIVQLDCMFPHLQLLKLLNSNTENPYLVWDNRTRAELTKYLEEQQQSMIRSVSSIFPTLVLLINRTYRCANLELLIFFKFPKWCPSQEEGGNSVRGIYPPHTSTVVIMYTTDLPYCILHGYHDCIFLMVSLSMATGRVWYDLWWRVQVRYATRWTGDRRSVCQSLQWTTNFRPRGKQHVCPLCCNLHVHQSHVYMHVRLHVVCCNCWGEVPKFSVLVVINVWRSVTAQLILHVHMYVLDL